jgi:hypothetical protein
MEVTAKTKEHPEVVKVEFHTPANLHEAVNKYGEEVVFNKFLAAAVIDLQAVLRRNIDKSQEELQKIAHEWKPGVRAPAVKQSAFEKATAAIGAITDPEERKALLKKLRELA